MMQLPQREEQVLSCLLENPAMSQRELAKNTGISLGLVNVILKKFIKTGVVQVANLNKRKLEYLLTAEGLLAVSKKTHNYVASTIRRYHTIQSYLITLFRDLERMGFKYYSIHGEGDLKVLVQSVFFDQLNGGGASLLEQARDEKDAVILNVNFEPLHLATKARIVNVLEQIKL